MAWRIVGSLSGVLAGLAARQVLLRTWRFFRDSDPPANPASRRTTWAEAVAWSVASGWPSAWPASSPSGRAGGGVAAATGSYPEDMESVTP